jgi:hypothetical protein
VLAIGIVHRKVWKEKEIAERGLVAGLVGKKKLNVVCMRTISK